MENNNLPENSENLLQSVDNYMKNVKLPEHMGNLLQFMLDYRENVNWPMQEFVYPEPQLRSTQSRIAFQYSIFEFDYYEEKCRSAHRSDTGRHYRYHGTGFRVACFLVA